MFDDMNYLLSQTITNKTKARKGIEKTKAIAYWRKRAERDKAKIEAVSHEIKLRNIELNRLRRHPPE